MRILFVGLTQSLHSARWINQLATTGWEIHIFDPAFGTIHKEFQKGIVYTNWRKPGPKGVRVRARYPLSRGYLLLQKKMPRLWKMIVPNSAVMLADLIRKINPDIIHALGMQTALYTILEAQDNTGNQNNIPIIYSSWGSDMYYYWHFPEHRKKIQAALAIANYIFTDCARDIKLAREYGFKGIELGVFPGGGGYPIELMRDYKQPGPVANRRTIAIKGLQTHAGRALNVVEALTSHIDFFKQYQVVIYHPHPLVRQAIQTYQSMGGQASFLNGSHPEMWSLFGRTRCAVAASISDGTPNAMLEAMIMGAFPIQTNPGGVTQEWIVDGENGFIISPEEAESIAVKMIEALTNDVLVNNAAEYNWEIARDRLNETNIRPRVIASYESVSRLMKMR